MKKYSILTVMLCVMVLGLALGCERREPAEASKSASGVKAATVKVKTNAQGLTVEQTNVGRRLMMDNKIGSVKHLYLISAYSGDVLLYSTVKGKVTSSGKRLTPTSVVAMEGQYVGVQHEGIPVRLGGTLRRTSEVLQDDGTYGSSIPYLYWWDVRDQYHQHYVSGGQILHVSDKPINVKNIVINLELIAAE